MKKESEMRFVNQQIRKYRRLANLTQAALAQRLDMNEKTYSWLEREGSPKADLLRRIADELGVSVDVLVNGEQTAARRDGPSELELQIAKLKSQTQTQEYLRFHDSGGIPVQFLKERAERKYSRKEEQLFDVLHSLPTRDKEAMIAFFDAYFSGDDASREDAQKFFAEFVKKHSAKDD